MVLLEKGGDITSGFWKNPGIAKLMLLCITMKCCTCEIM